MQSHRGEDAAGADDQELLGRARRDDGLEGSKEMGPDGKLVELVDRTIAPTQETMRQTDRPQREAAREHATLAAQDGNLEAAAAEVEGKDVGVGLVGRIGADAGGGEAGLHFAGDDGQRHAGRGFDLTGELLPADGFAYGAGGEHAAAGRPERTREVQQATDGRDGFGAGFGRERFGRPALGLETDGFGSAAEFPTIGRGDDRDLDGIGAYVDDGDDGHVQKRN